MGERDGEVLRPGGDAVNVGLHGAVAADGADAGNPVSRQIAKAKPPTPKAGKGPEIPKGFRLEASGLYYLEERQGEEDSPKARRLFVCAPLRVAAETRSKDQGQWGRLLEWQDRDGHPHEWPLPMSMLEGDPAAFCAALADQGLAIGQGGKARSLLARYIKHCAPAAKARCVPRIGWHGGVYVLPAQSIGEQPGERVLFQSGWAGPGDFRQRGGAAEWRDSVAMLCAGNSRPMFAIGMAFAAPLLRFAGEESGGAHFRGGSSCGKSTALWAAASVYGPPEGDDAFRKEWRATGNGLEGLATSRNDSLLILDEMGQVDGREAGSIAYMLANGQPKLRMSDKAALLRPPSWGLLFLSSGEISLADHMAASGKAIKAGQETRLADIPADAGAGLGVFDQINGHPSAAALSVAIREAAGKFHGAVGAAFIEQAARRQAALPERLKSFAAAFMAKAVPDGASGQVHRVAKRFALVAAALELAGEWGLTGWERNMGTHAAMACFADGLTQRGGAGDHEESAILAQVKAFFEAHAESRFADWHGAEKADALEQEERRPVAQRVGFRRRDKGEGFAYYVFPEAFKREICAGLDADRAAQTLARRGWIQPDNKGKNTQSRKIPGLGKSTRCYVFTPKLWEAP
jgi:putative DNA primase/helicase